MSMSCIERFLNILTIGIIGFIQLLVSLQLSDLSDLFSMQLSKLELYSLKFGQQMDSKINSDLPTLWSN